MSAIAGIINKHKSPGDGELLNAVCGSMNCRGAAGYGTYTVPGIALGERRIKGGNGELLASEDGRIRLVCDGAIWNAPQLRRELEKKGHVFSSESDLEVMIHLYEEEKESALSRLEGIFAFAIYDAREEKLLLGRDLMGIKPLYYFQEKGNFVFASSLESLKYHSAFPADLDPDALADYFSLLYVPQPQTVYRRVHALSAGHLLRFDCRTHTREIFPWKRIDFSQKLSGSREELAQELRRLVVRAVEKRLPEGTPGVFLSGGIDSNIIAGVTAELLEGKEFRAYTVGFAESAYDERALARLGAEAVRKRKGNLIHREREVKINDLSLMEELIRHCGQPYADSSLLPAALVCGFAREELPVLLSGDGADELFGGYERYLAMKMADKFEKIPLALRRTALKGISLFPEGGERSFAGRLKRFLRISCAPEEERYFAIIDRAPEALRQKLFAPDFYAALTASGSERFRRHTPRLTTSCRDERYSETDIHTYLTGDTLPKADISAMAHGLDVRSPFMDQEVCSFAAALPWEMKLEGKERKSILKTAFRDLLAPEILSAPKKGFGVPVARLLRTSWRHSARELLFEGPLRSGEFFRPESISQLYNEHQSGKKDHSYILWCILVFALFLKNRA